MASIRSINESNDKLAVAALRSLVIDVINKANSGHPGMALDAAPIVYSLFKNHLVADPSKPNWFNRDRFVLSSGHASSLLYSMLHMCGYGISMDDLKSFRQLDSLTPGHPEVGHTPGVDATAGPLGQGIAQAVGMAMAEEAIASTYPDGKRICSHYTYCLCGDGCLEEGISQEAISIAGKQRLSKLIVFYDRNGSTLDGPTSNSFGENVRLRFLASEWNVLEVKDGNNLREIDKAIAKAKKSTLFPTLIIVNTVIGYGSPHAGNHCVHGNPLGEEDGRKTKTFYGYDLADFTVPASVYEDLQKTFAARGKKAEEDWEEAYADFRRFHEVEGKVFADALKRNVKDRLFPMPEKKDLKTEASRSTSGKIVASLPKYLPFTLGGSADVASSVKTAIPGDPGFSIEHRDAKNVNFGIREFEMASIQNGILLHGGIVTYVGCFLIFSDYMKSAIRMSALEKIPAIYLFSHDSIAVGEDGPTHEPIEQLVALRSIPGLDVIRPADATETYAAWRLALESQTTPTALILSRQNLPLLDETSETGVSKGGYKVYGDKTDEYLIVATGSEVSLSIEAAKLLKEKGLQVGVVSMPSIERFEAQNDKYKASVLNVSRNKTIAIEMASSYSWYKYASLVIGIDTFGKSAPDKDVLDDYGFTPKKIASKIALHFKKK